MKKLLFVFLLVAGATLSSFAQKSDPGKFSIGIEGGLPVGDASNISSFTIGGSLKYEKPIAQKLAATISAGFIYFPYKTDVQLDITYLNPGNRGESFVPVKAGLKYWICSSFYGEGQVGAAFSVNGDGTSFAYSPGVGIKVSNNADIGVRYEGWTHSGNTLSQIGLRIAYSF